jgi:hypothetical protein
MWNSFELTIREPSMVRRVGKMETLLDIADKIENGVTLVAGSYLAMNAHYTTDSSYARTDDFFFPICFAVRRLVGQIKKTSVSTTEFSFWRRENDSRCLVMFNFSNSPENNFEGEYEEALSWIIRKIKE